MLYAMLAAALIFVLVLAVPAKTHRMARLFRARQKWAETMDRPVSPPCIVREGSCMLHDRGNMEDAFALAKGTEPNRDVPSTQYNGNRVT